MAKRIVICADGTWNRPEKNKKDLPTNVLKLARAIKPLESESVSQQVFYDWGVGSYYAPVSGGATGVGLNKNIMDDYRYIVQNYSPGDELFLFGFSRGSYTIRSLCGLINNCGILKRPKARLIQQAFDHYKKEGKAYAPNGEKSIAFRKAHSHGAAESLESRTIKFVGVLDTVGALGIPFSFMGLLDRKDEFYDAEIGPNIEIARHAMSIDEKRVDFKPTIWAPQFDLDLQQVWFAGVHTDIGGGYPPGKDGTCLSDIPLGWMMREAKKAGLVFEPQLRSGLKPNPLAKLHKSRKYIYRAKRPYGRPIDHGKSEIMIHQSVKSRYDSDPKYSPDNLEDYLKLNDWPTKLVK